MTRSNRALGLAACGWLAMLSFAQAQGGAEEAAARDLTMGQRPIYQFVQQQNAAQARRPAQERVAVEAWTDRVDSTFRIGEPVTVNVRPQRDAYITVLNVGTSGRATVLFPNHMQRDSRIRAGQVLAVGAPGAGYNIVPQGPAGVELVHVIATTRLLTLPELNQLGGQQGVSPFLSLGRNAEDLTRDLAVQVTGQQAGATAGPSGMATLLVRVQAPQPAQAAAPAGEASSAQLLAVLQQAGIPAVLEAPKPAAATPALPVMTGAITFPSGFAAPPVVIRTDRSVYGKGDAIQITVAALADCRLTLLSVGPTGNVATLLPNPAQSETRLRAGQVVMVPPPGSTVAIRPRGPNGMETIIGLCASDESSTAAKELSSEKRDLAAVTEAVALPAQAGAGVVTAATVYFVQP